MKHSYKTFAYVALFCLCLSSQQRVSGQGYGSPLILQGLSHTTAQSAASRAAGGITIGLKNDISMMFFNPASLSSLEGIQVSLGGLQQYTYATQEQHYGALQNHSAFSLLMEATTGEISDPDTTRTYGGTRVIVVDQTDSVQRPFDTIGPNWNRSKSKSLPVQGFLAVPFTLGEFRVVAGLGVVEYANLNWYYQNNNCLSPSVLSVLNGTISTSGLNANPYLSQWYQYYQQRDGSIYGYGGAFSAALSEKLSLGISAMLLQGSTDDQEVRVGRGRLVFLTNSLRLDKVGMTSYTKTGTSDYSGADFTFSGKYSGRNFAIGFSVKPPTTITREYSTQIWTDSVAAVSKLRSRVDSVHLTSTTSVSGEDKIALPWRGTIGVAITIREDLTVGLEYEMCSYSSATYTSSDGTQINPWLSSSVLHFGIEYRPNSWLAVRGGAREYAEAYEPIADALRGEAVKYPVYSVGCGVKFANARLNIAYEYSDMKYVDTWSNAASTNREIRQNLVANLFYEIPW